MVRIWTIRLMAAAVLLGYLAMQVKAG